MKDQCSDPAAGELLPAYELGLTSDSETERFEAHLLNCQHCLIRIEQFADESEALRHHPALRDAVAEALVAGRPVRGRRTARDLLWPTDFPWALRPGLALAALAAALIIGLAGWLQSPANKSVSSVIPIELTPYRTSAVATFGQPIDRDGLLSFACPGAVAGEPFRVTLRRDDRTVFQIDTFTTFDSFGLGRLFVPARLLTPGQYVLTVGPQSEVSDTTDLAYQFRIVKP